MSYAFRRSRTALFIGLILSFKMGLKVIDRKVLSDHLLFQASLKQLFSPGTSGGGVLHAQSSQLGLF